ncbi:sulfate transporter [Streptomyces spiroverticillatus]|uniref:Sulfate transporter n=1 Tax=Streptomyces finlayi TaxID=67296 RepID=A0A918X9R7_9ACTN|nr:STAS domain-containing protein [Streptomyces finlayi]GHA46801.1 sulfate transporter [Streptomyces spiroverticillatus]GHD18238.1 sulfate transporter [Streptomyces finlayi]
MPPAVLRLTTVDSEDRARIEITGDLDYDNADLLQEEVTALLTSRPDLQDLHLHCAQLGIVDSMGLSILLMIRRQTEAAQVGLHLDERPANLERLLDVTGTLEYFTGAPLSDAPHAHSQSVLPSVTEGEVRAAGNTRPDGTT